MPDQKKKKQNKKTKQKDFLKDIESRVLALKALIGRHHNLVDSYKVIVSLVISTIFVA